MNTFETILTLREMLRVFVSIVLGHKANEFTSIQKWDQLREMYLSLNICYQFNRMQS